VGRWVADRPPPLDPSKKRRTRPSPESSAKGGKTEGKKKHSLMSKFPLPLASALSSSHAPAGDPGLPPGPSPSASKTLSKIVKTLGGGGSGFGSGSGSGGSSAHSAPVREAGASQSPVNKASSYPKDGGPSAAKKKAPASRLSSKVFFAPGSTSFAPASPAAPSTGPLGKWRKPGSRQGTSVPATDPARFDWERLPTLPEKLRGALELLDKNIHGITCAGPMPGWGGEFPNDDDDIAYFQAGLSPSLYAEPEFYEPQM
jgi:hypothetical protein